MIAPASYDVRRLARALEAELRGSVGADARSRALYATDASNYRAVPDLVVVPADAEDLAAAVTLTAAAGAPVTLRGGGTSMAGNAIGGVVIDASRHVNRILDIDTDARIAVVEPGVVLTDLLAAALPHGLAFGADPSSASRATLGGMIANNACGAHSVAWGTTADNVRSLDVLLEDGTRCTVESVGDREELARRAGREGVLHRQLQAFVDRHELVIRRRFGQFTRQISGYALHRLLPENGYDVAGLLCGSEGGFATTLQATVALTPLPAAKDVVCVGVWRLDLVGRVRTGGVAARSADDGVDQYRPGRAASRRGPRRRDRGRTSGGTGVAAGGDGRAGPRIGRGGRRQDAR